MAETLQTTPENNVERLYKFGRNINALGAAAIAGVAVVIPGPNAVLGAWAGINAAQAGGFELLRRSSQSRRQKQTSNSQ